MVNHSLLIIPNFQMQVKLNGKPATGSGSFLLIAIRSILMEEDQTGGQNMVIGKPPERIVSLSTTLAQLE